MIPCNLRNSLLITHDRLSLLKCQVFDSPRQIKRLLEISIGILRFDVLIEKRLDQNLWYRNPVDANFEEIELAAALRSLERTFHEEIMSAADDRIDNGIARRIGGKRQLGLGAHSSGRELNIE